MNAGLGKIAIVVDDDIARPRPVQVQWAIAFRMRRRGRPHRAGYRPRTLDPSQPMKDGKPVLPAEQISSSSVSTPPANTFIRRPRYRRKNT